MFTVRAHGGLCNRLRVVLSYRAWRGSITCVWLPDEQIAGARWADVFEPLPGVSFLYEDPGVVDVMACDPTHAAPQHWPLTYRDVRLREEHEARRLGVRAALGGPYSAVHARRTDCTEMAQAAGAYTTDEELAAWAAQALAPIYIATDNGTTQRALAQALAGMGKRPAWLEDIPEASTLRHTTLAASAIDLFVCAGSAEFKGSGASSFTNAVHTMRKIGGWWQ